MGIDDRDYMRERNRNRIRGKSQSGSTLGKRSFNYGSGRWDHQDSLDLQRERITGRKFRRKKTGAGQFLTPGPTTALSLLLLLAFQGVRIFDDQLRQRAARL